MSGEESCDTNARESADEEQEEEREDCCSPRLEAHSHSHSVASDDDCSDDHCDDGSHRSSSEHSCVDDGSDANEDNALNESMADNSNDLDANSSCVDEQPQQYSSEPLAEHSRNEYKIMSTTFVAHENIRSLNDRPLNCLAMDSVDNWRSLEKWGESVNVFDSRGFNRRLITVNELRNYFELKLTSVQSEFSSVLCALVNSRYPRFYSSTVDYYQRWRMRYNLFVRALTAGITRDESAVVHVGEIHLYFDIVPKYNKPFYVNSSFYANKCDISGVCIGETLLNKIIKTVNSLRYSKEIFELQFPISGKLFRNCNFVFDKFMERQLEFVEEAQIIHRKAEQKKKRYEYWNQRRGSQPSSPYGDSRAGDQDVIFEDCGGDRSNENAMHFNRTNSNKMRLFSRQFTKRFADRRDTYSDETRPEFAQQNGFHQNANNRTDNRYDNGNNRRRNGRSFRRNNFETHLGNNMRKSTDTYHPMSAANDDTENVVSVNAIPNNYRRQQFTRPGYQFDIATN